MTQHLARTQRAANKQIVSSNLLRVSRRNYSLQAAAESAVTEQLPALLPLDEEYEEAHAFRWFANWLIKGRLLVGRYPFVEPSRCKSREQGKLQLEQVLDEGIKTFVSLQEELPPQPEMQPGGIKGFMPYYATACLLAKAREPPVSMAENDGLRNRYLDQFLPARRRESAWDGATPTPLSFVHEPITDLDIPSAETLTRLLDNLESRIRGGESVYLHCWGGRGRAGTVGATLLHRLYGLSADECLERVQRAFDTRKDDVRHSPQTEEQRQFVRAFIDGKL